MKKIFVIILNIGYWLCYFLLLMIILLLTVQPQKDFWQKEKYIAMTFIGVFTVLPAIISFYGSYFFLIPFINQKKHKKFVIGAVILILISITVTFFIVVPFINPNLTFEKNCRYSFGSKYNAGNFICDSWDIGACGKGFYQLVSGY